MAVWATIDENPHWKIPFEIAVRHLGPPAPQPPHAPGPHAFGDREYLRGILDGGRFCRDRDRGAAVSRPRRYARGGGRARNSASFLQRLLDEKQADEAARQAILRDIEAAFARYAASEGVRLPATFLLVRAHRPAAS